MPAVARPSPSSRRVAVVANASGGKNRLREKERRKADERRAREPEKEGARVANAPARAVDAADAAVDAKRVAASAKKTAGAFVRKVRRKAKKVAQKAVDALAPRSDPFASARTDGVVRVGAVSGTRARAPTRVGGDASTGRAVAAWGSIFAAAWIAMKLYNRENPLRAVTGVMSGRRRERPPPPGAEGPGRWVIDRSLGGRTIWVPDARDKFRDERRRLEGALDALPGEASDATARNAGRAANASSQRAAKELPKWWVEPTPQYVPPGRKEELVQAARAEGAKLARKRVSGVGFSADDIADFRTACAAAGERGCAVKSVGPESARVAVFRAAADFAVTDAMRGQAGATSSFNTPVGPFLVGLSDDLELDPQKCVSIVMADVAVRVRGVIIQASAGLRSGDSVTTMLELDKLVMLFNIFPFTADAAELDMLAVGFRSRLSESERERIVKEYEAVSGGAYADVVRAAVCGPESSVYE